MEQLLHYVWRHKIFPLTGMQTTDGQALEVIDTGLHNRNAGPDFFNAKIKIGGTLWVGNVEIHDRASDWRAHGHDHDEAYDNVVLHVVGTADAEARTRGGRRLPQLVLGVPPRVAEHYAELMKTAHYPPCYKIIPHLSRLTIDGWLSALQAERLEQKTEAILQRVARCEGDWASAYFVTLARNYGFGINGDAFEQWAQAIPLPAVAHHRDNCFQVEAIFMGQAGLLDAETIPGRHREAALAEGFFGRLSSEYRYLARKFGLKPIDAGVWRFLRLRPQNFPHIRIAQLASLYCDRRAGLDSLLEAADTKAMATLFNTGVTPYWTTHYAFGSPGAKHSKRLSARSINLLMINTAIPMLFAYGRHHRQERLCDRAMAFLDELKAEDNAIVRMWNDCGLAVSTAGDSQALIQLRRQYCERKDCLRCRIGYEYLCSDSREDLRTGQSDIAMLHDAMP